MKIVSIFSGAGGLDLGFVILPHPNGRRRMTGRELATVQGFPTDSAFAGTLSSVYRQIGNAVPPPFAETIARQFWYNPVLVQSSLNSEREQS